VVAVFDACEICGPVGFFKGPNGLVCKNCASPINSQSVGTAGGCNPIPLQSTGNGGAIVIQEADLAARVKVFQR
jgi:high-affinity iron transporter